MYEVIKNTINYLLSPNLCIVCEKLIESNVDDSLDFQKVSKHFCKSCYINLPLTENHAEIKNEILKNIKIEDLYVDNFYSLLNKMQDDKYIKLIYGLKYEKRQDIAKTIAYLLNKMNINKEQTSENISFLYNYNVFIPVPIHYARKRERGFNQAELIANELSKLSKVPTQLLIKRTKNNQTQTKLTQKERQKNITNIFSLYTKSYFKTYSKINFINTFSDDILNFVEENKSKKVLIIDDVLTTGATVNSIAKELKNLGFSHIDVLTYIKA